MEEFYPGEISAFGHTAVGTAWLQNETVSCWPSRGADGSQGLLWQICLSREALERTWGLTSGSGLSDAQMDRRILEEMEAQKTWSEANPGVMLAIRQIRVQPYLMDPAFRELHLLTAYAQPLRRAFSAGLRQEQKVAELGLALCHVCKAAGSAGCLVGCLSPERFLLGPEGQLLLAPVWPGTTDSRPAGFCIDAPPAVSQAYSAAMLLFWLLNGGELPFVQEAARSQDAERRRLLGEPLPALAGVSAEMSELLRRVCQLPVGHDCNLEALEQGLLSLQSPEQKRVRQPAQEKQRLRQQQDPAEREQEEEQLRRAREKEQRKAGRSLGSDAADRLLLGLLMAGVAVGVVAVCLFLSLQAVRRLQSSMEAGNYATALEQIEQTYRAGKDANELVELYAEQCLQENDYIRAMAAYTYWTGSTAPDADRLRAVVELTIQEGEPRRAEKFLTEFAKKGTACADLAQQIRQEYSEELAT